MNITELIAKLEEIREIEGDLEVFIFNQDLYQIEEILDTDSCFSVETAEEQPYINDRLPEGKFLTLQGGGFYGAAD